MLPVLFADLAVPRLAAGRPRTRPECLIADKAYSSRGGRPVSYDRDLYRHRNVIERGFNTFKQWRGLAGRYDRLAITYRGGAVLRAIVIWLNYLCDTP